MTQGAQAIEELLRQPASRRARLEPLLTRWWDGEPVHAVGLDAPRLADMVLLLETARADYLVIETPGHPAAVLCDRPFPEAATALVEGDVRPGRIDGRAAVGLVLMRLDQGGRLTLSEGWAAV